MNVFEKAARVMGIRLVGDKLPKEHRKVATLQELLALSRAFQDAADEKRLEMEQDRIRQFEHVRWLEQENSIYRLREAMRPMTLTAADQATLLGCVTAAPAAVVKQQLEYTKSLPAANWEEEPEVRVPESPAAESIPAAAATSAGPELAKS
jgi:hypothetical protein